MSALHPSVRPSVQDAEHLVKVPVMHILGRYSAYGIVLNSHMPHKLEGYTEISATSNTSPNRGERRVRCNSG